MYKRLPGGTGSEATTGHGEQLRTGILGGQCASVASIKGVTRKSLGLAPYDRVRVSTERPAEQSISEGAAQLQQRPQHFVDASTTGQQPSTAAAVEGPSLIL